MRESVLAALRTGRGALALLVVAAVVLGAGAGVLAGGPGPLLDRVESPDWTADTDTDSASAPGAGGDGPSGGGGSNDGADAGERRSGSDDASSGGGPTRGGEAGGDDGDGVRDANRNGNGSGNGSDGSVEDGDDGDSSHDADSGHGDADDADDGGDHPDADDGGSGGGGSGDPARVDLSMGEVGSAPVGLRAVSPGETGSFGTDVHNRGEVAGDLAVEIVGLVDHENGVTEPEASVDDSADRGELGDRIRVRVAFVDERGRETYLLGGDEAYAPLAALEDGTGGLRLPPQSSGYLRVDWRIPVGVGNEIQSDSVTADLAVTLTQE